MDPAPRSHTPAAAASVADSNDGNNPANSPPSSLFEVYLRLRPPSKHSLQNPRFLSTIPTQPTHVYITPPADPQGRNRFRAIEKFSFTEIFDEAATQRDIFEKTVTPLFAEVVKGKDVLLATLGVTGSGKTHTILGGNGQRGMTQMALDALFTGLTSRMVKVSMEKSDCRW